MIAQYVLADGQSTPFSNGTSRDVSAEKAKQLKTVQLTDEHVTSSVNF